MTTNNDDKPTVLPLGDPQAKPFVPAMDADYYAKWDRLHKATQRAWSRLVRERSQASIDAYTSAMGRLAEHEEAFGAQPRTTIEQ